jgi:hypothetical protein
VVSVMSAKCQKRTSRRCRERALSRMLEKHSSAWQNNPDFGELAQLSIDFNCPRMLLYDDGEAKPGIQPGLAAGLAACASFNAARLSVVKLFMEGERLLRRRLVRPRSPP